MNASTFNFSSADRLNAEKSAENVGAGTICAVLMAGGSGTRLWPASRRRRPKPFLPLLPDGRSTLAATFDRLDGLVAPENRWVVAGREFAALVREALPRLAPNRLLLEPCGRDTAPCVAWSALEATRIDPNATLIVLPCDHYVRPDAAFRTVLARAVRLVADDPTRLATLGVVPTEPSSAYGYIERGASLVDFPNEFDAKKIVDFPNEFDAKKIDSEAFSVASFREKPDAETARRFVESGRFFWNAGVFVWKGRRVLELLARFEPELAATFERVERLAAPLAENPNFIREFSAAKRISIDYAVLERAPNVVVLPASFAWDDLGAFAALDRIAPAPPDADENLAFDSVLVAENSRRNVVRTFSSSDAPSKKRKLIALLDVDDLLVVETDDALLVAKKGNETALRRLVARLERDGFDEFC